MNEKTIKTALRKGERVTLECKKAMAEVPKSLWETYSAFANTIGGLILLGVEEHRNEANSAKRYEIVGVTDAQKILSDFWNTINSDKVNANILTDSDVEVVNMGDKQIVSVHVPMADWRAKPIYLNGNVYKGTFRRNHEGDYHCTEDQVKAMIRDSNTEGNDGILIDLSNGIPKDQTIELSTEVSNGVSKGVSNEVPKGVSDMAKIIYESIKTNPNITRNELADLAGISIKNLQKHLNKLKEIGLIKRVGSTRQGHWEVAENKEAVFFTTQDVGINGEDVGINDKNVGIKLTERQRIILEMIVLNPTLSAKGISEKISEKTSEKGSEKTTITDRTIEKDLAQLKKKGILKRIGGRKSGHWVVSDAFVSENDSKNDTQRK